MTAIDAAIPDSGLDGSVFPEVFCIEEFVVHDCAACGHNPFQCMSHNRWCVDQYQIECAGDLWDSLSQQLHKILFETFRDDLRVRRCAGSRLCER